MRSSVVAGCALLVLACSVAWIAAVVWAIVDLTSGNIQHKVLDIAIVVITATSLLGGASKK